MLKLKIYMAIVALVVACAPALHAIDVTSTAPGTLRSAVDNPGSVTSLRISGPVDASDLFFIAREMPALTSLDLGGADIREYRGRAIAGRTGYAAGLIPQNLMADHSLTSLTLPQGDGVVIGAGAFARNPLAALTIGAGVKAVGDGAFMGCENLRSATIGAAAVGAGAFASCPALERVTLSAAGTSLDAAAFADNAALTAIDGAARVSVVGPSAFRGCTALKAFDFGTALHTVGEGAFSGSGLVKADLSGCTALDSIGAWAFAGMPALTEARLGSAPRVGDGVVFMCPALERFTPSDATDRVGAYAYVHDRRLLAEGILPEGTRIIGAHALHGLSTLTELTLPSTTEKIGDGAMAGMTGLKSISSEAADVPALGSEVWRGVDQPSVTLTVPTGSADDYRAADQWQRFHIIEYSGIDDIAGDEAGTTAPDVRGRFAGRELQVEATGADIARIALHDASGLLLLALEPYDSRVAIDTEGMMTRIYIVAVTLADGRTATLKLARR